MLGAKADYYEKQCDDLTLSRILKAVGPISNPIPSVIRGNLYTALQTTLGSAKK